MKGLTVDAVPEKFPEVPAFVESELKPLHKRLSAVTHTRDRRVTAVTPEPVPRRFATIFIATNSDLS
ncbi:MAG: hypothetical protein J6X60_12405 [Ruminiclostridium sp.]|nr:hypothetical protein [Ruminiclostridium sp.]